MIVEGFWRFSISEEAAAAGVELPSALVLLQRGQARGMELSPTVAGHYRVNGSTLTCFLRSLQRWSNPPRPIYQFVGELSADIIALRGTCVERAEIKFDARLMRPELSAAPTVKPARDDDRRPEGGPSLVEVGLYK